MSLPAYSLDFVRQVQMGQISGARIITQRGSFSPTTGQTRTVWSRGATANQPIGAADVAMEVVSDSANDAAAGTGVRTMTIEGVKASGALQTETVTLNGTTPVTLANTYTRFNAAQIATCGSVTTNAGNVDLRVVSGSAIQARMPTNRGVLDHINYTVPTGKVAFLLRLHIAACGTGADTAAIAACNLQGWLTLSTDGTLAAASQLSIQEHRLYCIRGQGLEIDFGWSQKYAAATLYQPSFQNTSAFTVEVACHATFLEMNA